MGLNTEESPMQLTKLSDRCRCLSSVGQDASLAPWKGGQNLEFGVGLLSIAVGELAPSLGPRVPPLTTSCTLRTLHTGSAPSHASTVAPGLGLEPLTGHAFNRAGHRGDGLGSARGHELQVSLYPGVLTLSYEQVRSQSRSL